MATPRIEELKSRISLADLIGQRITLKKSGKEFKALCPFHKENSPSFSVFTDATGAERFYCHGCGESGDHLDWLKKIDGLDDRQALARLREIAGDGSPLVRKEPAKPKKPRYTFSDTAPDGEPPPSSIFSHKAGGERPVVAAWAYRNPAGQLLGYTCRVEVDGKKEVIPVRWTKSHGWRQQALETPRPLYGADLIAANPGLNIIVGEGEKAADAGRRLVDGFPVLVITWAGGCGAVTHSDWSQLKGRQVALWPDCDSKRYPDNHERAGEFMPYLEQPGMLAMLSIAQILEEIGCDVRIVNVPPPGIWPDGHDFADLEAEGWTQGDILAYIKEQGATAYDLMGGKQPFEQVVQVVDQGDRRPYPEDLPSDPEATHWLPVDDDDLPFRILGHDDDKFYYYPKDTCEVVALTASQHKALNLFMLAGLPFWSELFPSRRVEAEWTRAGAFLMDLGRKKGKFHRDRIRGRGAWWDKGRAVINLGTALIVDGVRTHFAAFKTDFVYNSGLEWTVNPDDALPTSESIELVRILQAVHWERPINALLAAGWALLAPIGGALEYRPSIWISGASGVGKTTVQNKIIGRTMAGIRLYCAANTTEPGLRQELRQDAIPVQFDEFEADNQDQAKSVMEIERLVTQSATDDGAGIYKGGTDGKAVRYIARSMFCFCSVAVMIPSQAIGSRISVLSLLPPDRGKTNVDYQDLVALIDKTLSLKYIARLQARAVKLLPVIRHNAKVFADAISQKFKSQRMGDQYGTLLAGAYALHSSNEITLKVAMQWVESQDWEEEHQVYEDGDESKLLNFLSGQTVRLQSQSGVSSDYTVGELIEKCLGKGTSTNSLALADAEDALARTGLRVDLVGRTLWIANNHPKLSRILRETAWGHSWARTLSRIPGSTKEASVRFAGVKSRYVAVPIEVLE
jgi:putative DNA primase/helicase